MGGLVESGMFVIWGLIVPIGVLVLLGPTAGALAIVGYAGCVALCASGYRPWPELPSLPPEVASVMIAGNIVGTGLLVGIAVTWTLNRLEHEERVRAKMQAESMRAQKLEAIGTLAAGIAHDFNNILMAFGGHVTHARRTTRPEDPANASLVKAERALEQAAGLARQLLAFSKGGAPVRTVASLAEVVRDSTTFVLHGSNCACVFEAPPDLWPVEGDASQISQVIQNIALNAAQAMPDGGTVSVACANVPPGADMHGEPADRKYVSVSVSDSGVGVPEGIRERIFEPYFTMREGGTGLGLATSYAIVRSHGGRIELRSEMGRGSTFTVYLPATDKKPEKPLATQPARARLQGRRVLVMDDEPAVREVLHDMLEDMGCVPTVTSDGREAIAQYDAAMRAGAPFAAVILDLTVRGGMGGVETVKHLLGLDPTARVLASSGYVDDSTLERHKEHGFFSVLRKPYRPDTLRWALTEAMAEVGKGPVQPPTAESAK
jgi:signal transduction histidine kinase/CheY-like chemotaxis protein